MGLDDDKLDWICKNTGTTNVILREQREALLDIRSLLFEIRDELKIANGKEVDVKGEGGSNE